MRTQLHPLFAPIATAMALVLLAAGQWASAADAPAKPKPKWNCWAPQEKPLRAILHYDGRQANLKDWAPFCERHGLAWCVGEFDLLTENRLAEVAEQLGRPELVNAPVIRTGLSSNGGTTIQLAHQHSDRMLAGVATQPLAPFAAGNDAFNFNRPNSKGDLEGKTYDVSRAFRAPILIQTGENDSTCGSVLAYGLTKFARSKEASWTYLCLPRGGHGNDVPRELAMAWLEAVIAQRLPADVDLRKGPPKLKEINVEAGWLGNTQTLEIAEYAKYSGDKSKACWLPNQATAELWKKFGLSMPYEFPEQTVQKPAGLIADLVVHDPKANQIVSSDAAHGEPWKIVANLKEGDIGWKVQPNCTVTVFGKVPDLVRGCDWIKPDNTSAEFAGDVLLEFTVSKDAVVYVAHDEKTAQKPAWLADWKDTGEFVLGGYLGNEQSFRLFEKKYAKGTKCKLGPNGERAKDPRTGRPVGWIYLTIVKPAAK